MKTVSTKKELAEALKANESTIVVTGGMIKHIKKMKAIKNTAWGIAFAALGGAIYLAIATPAATVATTPVGGAISFKGSLVAGGAAATILGIKATTFLVGLGVAAGGTGAVSKLRLNYNISESSSSKLVLKKN